VFVAALGCDAVVHLLCCTYLVYSSCSTCSLHR